MFFIRLKRQQWTKSAANWIKFNWMHRILQINITRQKKGMSVKEADVLVEHTWPNHINVNVHFVLQCNDGVAVTATLHTHIFHLAHESNRLSISMRTFDTDIHTAKIVYNSQLVCHFFRFFFYFCRQFLHFILSNWKVK